jgi:hypothetical protein
MGGGGEGATTALSFLLAAAAVSGKLKVVVAIDVADVPGLPRLREPSEPTPTEAAMDRRDPMLET